MEKITLNFSGDIHFDSLDPKERYIFSVMNNIERILNTRRGSVKHIPDYGLPDLSVIYRHLPSSLSLLQKYITFTVLKYEPRVQALQIQMVENKSTDFVIVYELLCQLKEVGYIRFSTTFDADESVRVFN
ncbi:MAG: type VI secretion system baseplate subunit TssE [Snodgrassella sp.]|nr:type VI secretion system baseplate subunit TssE [Snodgrassella sp.]